MPLWERALYRFLLIPATRKALAGAGAALRLDGQPAGLGTRTDRSVQSGEISESAACPDDGTIGNSDMMPLWAARGTRGNQHASVFPALGRAADGPPRDGGVRRDRRRDDTTSRFRARKATLDQHDGFRSRLQAPPPSPFSTARPAGDPYHVDAAAVAAGGRSMRRNAPTAMSRRCSLPHADPGRRGGHRPAPHRHVDRRRRASATPTTNRGYAWGFRNFQKTEGYVATSHARAVAARRPICTTAACRRCVRCSTRRRNGRVPSIAVPT